MSVGRLLLELQSVDQRLAVAGARLVAIDRAAGDRAALTTFERKLAAARRRQEALESKQRSLDLEALSARARVNDVEERLYGGSVTSPRELQDLGRELANSKQRLQGVDDRVLENMVALEDVQHAVVRGEEAWLKGEEAWERAQEELAAEKLRLQSSARELMGERRAAARSVDQQSLATYERVRKAKGGEVVVKVERGLCRGCGVTLPTHRVQQARSSNTPIQCASCQKILFT